MTKKTYYEKLKDPRWQKLRLEVMQANDFCCVKCGDSKSTLNVHHKEYFKGKEPWEYEVKQLACICEECHFLHHETKDLLKYVSSFLDYDGPKDRDEIALFIAGFIGMPLDEVLEGSSVEMCDFATWAYENGVKANKEKISLLDHIKKQEDKNG